MSEEDLSGHVHTYPKTYDRNVPKKTQNLTVKVSAKIKTEGMQSLSLVQSKTLYQYSHDFEQKLFTFKECSFHGPSRLD